MGNFTVTSPEFKDQDPLQQVHEFNGFDGEGQNRSPALHGRARQKTPRASR